LIRLCDAVDANGDIDLMFLEDCLEVVSIGSSVEELVLSGFCVEKAAHCVASA
jgi:hypothetical protein